MGCDAKARVLLQFASTGGRRSLGSLPRHEEVLAGVSGRARIARRGPRLSNRILPGGGQVTSMDARFLACLGIVFEGCGSRRG